MPRKIEEVEQSLTIEGWGVVSPGTTVEVPGAWQVGCQWIVEQFPYTLCAAAAPYRRGDGTVFCGRHWKAQGLDLNLAARPESRPESLHEAFDRLTNMAKDAQAVAKAQAEKHLVWFDAPAPSPGERVIEPRVRAVNLWDFLMRASFSHGMPRPNSWVKVALEEYFKLQEEYHRAATTNVWSK